MLCDRRSFALLFSCTAATRSADRPTPFFPFNLFQRREERPHFALWRITFLFFKRKEKKKRKEIGRNVKPVWNEKRYEGNPIVCVVVIVSRTHNGVILRHQMISAWTQWTKAAAAVPFCNLLHCMFHQFFLFLHTDNRAAQLDLGCCFSFGDFLFVE